MAATLLKSTVATLGAADAASTVLGLPSPGFVAVQLTGTFSATVTFETTVDGTTWVALNMTPSNSGTAASTATATGAWSASTGGYAGFRARCSAYTSGSIVATVRYTAQ